MKAYYVSFQYPDGHVEEIEEVFVTVEKAVSYGNALLQQVQATERFKRGGNHSAKDARFVVNAKDGNESELVYDSFKK